MLSPFILKLLPEFDNWLNDLRDIQTRLRLVARLRRAQLGNLGDIKSVGSGVFEMREHFGPGWRMYFIRQQQSIIVMLAGGSKASQKADINKAINLANLYKESDHVQANDFDQGG